VVGVGLTPVIATSPKPSEGRRADVAIVFGCYRMKTGITKPDASEPRTSTAMGFVVPLPSFA